MEKVDFWDYEFKLAELADDLGMTRKDLIKNFPSLPYQIQDEVRWILTRQVEVLKAPKLRVVK